MATTQSIPVAQASVILTLDSSQFKPALQQALKGQGSNGHEIKISTDKAVRELWRFERMMDRTLSSIGTVTLKATAPAVAFGALSIREALKQGGVEAKKLELAMAGVKDAQARIGTELLKIKVGGKNATEWLQTFANILNKISPERIEKIAKAVGAIAISAIALKGFLELQEILERISKLNYLNTRIDSRGIRDIAEGRIPSNNVAAQKYSTNVIPIGTSKDFWMEGNERTRNIKSKLELKQIEDDLIAGRAHISDKFGKIPSSDLSPLPQWKQLNKDTFDPIYPEKLNTEVKRVVPLFAKLESSLQTMVMAISNPIDGLKNMGKSLSNFGDKVNEFGKSIGTLGKLGMAGAAFGTGSGIASAAYEFAPETMHKLYLDRLFGGENYEYNARKQSQINELRQNDLRRIIEKQQSEAIEANEETKGNIDQYTRNFRRTGFYDNNFIPVNPEKLMEEIKTRRGENEKRIEAEPLYSAKREFWEKQNEGYDRTIEMLNKQRDLVSKSSAGKTIENLTKFEQENKISGRTFGSTQEEINAYKPYTKEIKGAIGYIGEEYKTSEEKLKNMNIGSEEYNLEKEYNETMKSILDSLTNTLHGVSERIATKAAANATRAREYFEAKDVLKKNYEQEQKKAERDEIRTLSREIRSNKPLTTREQWLQKDIAKASKEGNIKELLRLQGLAKPEELERLTQQPMGQFQQLGSTQLPEFMASLQKGPNIQNIAGTMASGKDAVTTMKEGFDKALESLQKSFDDFSKHLDDVAIATKATAAALTTP